DAVAGADGRLRREIETASGEDGELHRFSQGCARPRVVARARRAADQHAQSSMPLSVRKMMKIATPAEAARLAVLGEKEPEHAGQRVAVRGRDARAALGNVPQNARNLRSAAVEHDPCGLTAVRAFRFALLAPPKLLS